MSCRTIAIPAYALGDETITQLINTIIEVNNELLTPDDNRDTVEALMAELDYRGTATFSLDPDNPGRFIQHGPKPPGSDKEPSK